MHSTQSYMTEQKIKKNKPKIKSFIALLCLFIKLLRLFIQNILRVYEIILNGQG